MKILHPILQNFHDVIIVSHSGDFVSCLWCMHTGGCWGKSLLGKGWVHWFCAYFQDLQKWLQSERVARTHTRSSGTCSQSLQQYNTLGKMVYLPSHLFDKEVGIQKNINIPYTTPDNNGEQYDDIKNRARYLRPIWGILFFLSFLLWSPITCRMIFSQVPCSFESRWLVGSSNGSHVVFCRFSVQVSYWSIRTQAKWLRFSGSFAPCTVRQ